MGAKAVGENHYKSDILVRSFEYYATSRSLFNKLRIDFELPEVSTMTKLTSKTKKIEDDKYLKSVFSQLKGEQKKFILLHDEIYVKSKNEEGNFVSLDSDSQFMTFI